MNQEEYARLKQAKMLHANIDPETGEIISLTMPYKPMKSNLGGGWMAMYQDALNWMADANLPNEQYRVLMKLLARLDFENYLRVTQSEIAKELNMKQPNVAKAIKALLEQDIIRKGPKVGNSNTYRLNPYIGHKGQNISQTKKEYDHLKRIK
ncbi:replication/maintenance protein RepL [Bacillus sp. FJAT-27231]|uniref:replication/maintenance protein RepL n=1 Tax=Bacillus sp. FJAT-27231 TaxID=1679168 RepID=UPI00069E1153|nr:replication/maintenance protein RepL [Bacillus sp. FJAT-27231]